MVNDCKNECIGTGYTVCHCVTCMVCYYHCNGEVCRVSMMPAMLHVCSYRTALVVTQVARKHFAFLEIRSFTVYCLLKHACMHTAYKFTSSVQSKIWQANEQNVCQLRLHIFTQNLNIRTVHYLLCKVYISNKITYVFTGSLVNIPPCFIPIIQCFTVTHRFLDRFSKIQ
jgi:hypothetical protein